MNDVTQPDDPHRPIVVATFETEVEAMAVVAALFEAGIEAHSVGSFTADFRAEAPGVIEVLVRHCDLEPAQSAIDTLLETRGTTDWSKVDTGTPEGESTDHS